MVLTNTIHTPQSFVEALTDKCYLFNTDNDAAKIHSLLTLEGLEDEDSPLWDYPLSEIEHIVENNINVVLVEIVYFDEDDVFQREYRWFEVPEEYADAVTAVYQRKTRRSDEI